MTMAVEGAILDSAFEDTSAPIFSARIPYLAPIVAFVIFVSVFCIHGSSRVITSTDSVWSVYVAKSLLDEGNFNLDEYREEVRKKHSYGVRKKHDHLYNFFPPGVALITATVLYVYELLPAAIVLRLPGFGRFRNRTEAPTAVEAHREVERLIASLFMAVTTVLLFAVFFEVAGIGPATFLALYFAFGTSAWSIASRALWQHGPSMLLLTIGLVCVTRKQRPALWCALAALPIAFSYVVRPSNVIPLVFFGFFALRKGPRAALGYAACAAAILIPFALINLELSGRLLPAYYTGRKLSDFDHLFEALAAHLVSPNRGLLVFSPLLLLLPWSIWTLVRRKEFSALHATLLAIIAAHLYVVSIFDTWWGGHTYGPRYMSDLYPYFVYLLTPLFRELSNFKNPRHVVVWVLACVLFAVSSWIHYRGANSMAVHLWNAHPRNIDEYHDRVWSVRDLQMRRGL